MGAPVCTANGVPAKSLGQMLPCGRHRGRPDRREHRGSAGLHFGGRSNQSDGRCVKLATKSSNTAC